MRATNAANHRSQLCRIFGINSRTAPRFGVAKILAILSRTNSTDITKDLRKVLLSFETTGYGHVQYSRIRSTQHRSGALDPLAQNKLMRGRACGLAKHPGEMSCAQSDRLRHLVETQVVSHLRVDQ